MKRWQMWACVGKNNYPLGYVNAETKEEAVQKALERWGDSFVRLYKWDGVL